MLRTDSSRNQDAVSRLIFELSKLPGIGEKTATRLAYFILKQDASFSKSLAEALVTAKEKIGLCPQCFTFTDVTPCRICTDPGRDRSVICAVERPADVISIEQAGSYRGLYHVLHGALSPLDGIGPDELKIRELVQRVATEAPAVREVILATNPSVEGEATSLYLARMLRHAGRIGSGGAAGTSGPGGSPSSPSPTCPKITKLAHGLPVGGMLEYTDRQTIGKALENRMELGG